MFMILFFLVSAKTGDNINKSMNALITEIIRKETNIKVIDVNNSNNDDEVDAYDDEEPDVGTSFWAGHGSPGWSAETAVTSRTLPPLDDLNDYKVAFLGAEKTGAKTSFLKRYVFNTFSLKYDHTLDSEFMSRVETYRGNDIKLLLCGMTENDKIASESNFKKSCLGAVIGYDITNRESLKIARREYMSYWKDYPYVTIMVIGNKMDLGELREVSKEEGEMLARDLHASLFFEGKLYKHGHSIFSASALHFFCFVFLGFSFCKDRRRCKRGYEGTGKDYVSESLRDESSC